MSVRECPNCATDVPANVETCPICRYEFPRRPVLPWKPVALALLIVIGVTTLVALIRSLR